MNGPDKDLFERAMSDVAPLPERQRKRDGSRPSDNEDTAARARAKVKQRAAAMSDSRVAEDANCFTLGEVPQLQPHDVLAWKQPGVQEGVYRKLRLGKYAPEATLDLHRHSVREARAALLGFLQQSQRVNRRTLLISHGRGVHGATPARLKSYVAHWLRQCPEVIAMHSAQQRHGGTGSVYALLRKSPEDKEINRERHGGRG
jgi:DNA-nicking Smr family endonuclease